MTPLAKLRILSGNHKDAIQSLTSADLAIGSSLNADIVLTDLTVAPVHARLTCGYFALELKAADAAVVAGGRKIAPGESAKIAFPARFLLGDVEVECASSQRGTAISGLSSRIFVAVASGVLLILTAALAVPPLQRVANSPARGSLEDSANPLGFKGEGNAPAIITARPDTVETAILALRKRLVLEGLQSIQVSAEDGIVRAKGDVTQAQEQAWRSVELWFDGSFGQKVMLQAEVTISIAKIQNLPINIQAVWAGKKPYLIDEHGDKYFEGSLLRDRWVIERIQNNKVILRRNDEILTLEL